MSILYSLALLVNVFIYVNTHTTLNCNRRFLFTQKLLIGIKRSELNKNGGERKNMIFLLK